MQRHVRCSKTKSLPKTRHIESSQKCCKITSTIYIYHRDTVHGRYALPVLIQSYDC